MATENPVAKQEASDEEEIVADYNDESVEVSEYWITSYGIDYDVEGIVRRVNKRDIDFPGFQRKYVWDIRRASRFIESLLMRLPVPGIFLYREQDTQKQLVIDGQQRLESLRRFYGGQFNGREFSLTGVRKSLEGMTYKDLTEGERRKLDDSIIHATVIRQDKPDDGGSSQYEIFERLNTNATPLSPQEIRAAIYHGDFNDLLVELNHFEDWRKLFGRVNKRGRDQELILRFLALYFELDDYSQPMKGFLNKFMSGNRNLEKYPREETEAVFCRTVTTILNKIGAKAFKPSRGVNAAVLDALMVGIARRLANGGDIRSTLTLQYDMLFEDKRFIDSITAGTSRDENVLSRLQIATDAFANVD